MLLLEKPTRVSTRFPHKLAQEFKLPCTCSAVDFDNPEEVMAYDAFVESHPDATLFHGLAWKRAVERAFGHQSFCIVARLENRIRGVFPLFEINSVLAGRFMVSMPYATYGGPLSLEDDTTQSLLNYARELTSRRGCRSLELRTIQAADQSLPLVKSHATFIGDLPADPTEIDDFLPRKARASARSAEQKSGLSNEFDPADLRDVWQLYSRSMRRLGSPNYPLRFFEELQSAIGDNVLVQLVRHRRTPVAGLVSFVYRDTLMPYFAGIDDRLPIYGLSHYLHREAMRWGVRRHLKKYDFGRSRLDNAGAFNFKRLCGFVPQTLEYQTYVAPGSSAPDLAASSPRWSLARRCWQ
jgi:FemAB-related protein (PEP-CTERM system-associated)